jgi:hypothetical protein
VPETDPTPEFDRQLDNLRNARYPRTLIAEALALRELVPASGSSIPFVIVATGLPAEQAISRVQLRGKTGFTSMEADDLKRFSPIPGVELPRGSAYLITDVDTGQATLGVTPEDGLEVILGEGRSPLTLDEGLALAMHFPDALRSMNCFEMVGSRCGDRRVTGVWVSKDGRPRLGWCWVGNPHSWLGMASCAQRVGAELTAGPRSEEPAVH